MSIKSVTGYALKTLATILIALVGYMWVSMDSKLEDCSRALRRLELNQAKIMTVLDITPAAAAGRPGRSQTGERAFAWQLDGGNQAQ